MRVQDRRNSEAHSTGNHSYALQAPLLTEWENLKRHSHGHSHFSIKNHNSKFYGKVEAKSLNRYSRSFKVRVCS